MRSIAVNGDSFAGFLVVVYFALLVQCTAENNPNEETRSLRNEQTEISKEFLAGEDTPIWVTDAPDRYEKLPKGTLKWAFEHFLRKDNIKLGMIRKSPSSARMIDLSVKYYHGKVNENLENERTARTSSASGNNVVYPTILVVMNYNGFFKPFDKTNLNVVGIYVTYALAFWNNVNVRLREIIDPRVSLRIAGIVIGNNRTSQYGPFPYMNSTEWRYAGGLSPMYAHWRYDMAKNNDFPTNSYDIVVHMADYTHAEKLETSWMGRITYVKKAIFVTSENICGEDYSNIIKVAEPSYFEGVEPAVYAMRALLGDTDIPYENVRRHHQLKDWPKLSDRSRNKIKDALGKTTCFAEPKEYHPPGEPLPSILPGQMLDFTMQCAGHAHHCLPPEEGYVFIWPKPRQCNNEKPCLEMRCYTTDPIYPVVWTKYTALDGTDCSFANVNPKICLEGNCVNNEWMVLSNSENLPKPEPLRSLDWTD